MNFASKSIAFLAFAAYLTSCSTAPSGQQVQSGNATNIDSTKAAAAKTLNVDVAASKIEWLGTKTGGQHNGDLKVKSGTVKVEGGKIVGGSFVLDMTTINVLDLKDKAKADLEGHLKTGDFFEVEKHPEGKFDIAEVKEGSVDSTAKFTVTGNLTLKGVTKSVSIPANLTVSDAGVTATTPQFTINREDWGITYQSTMKNVVLNSQMGIKITLSAK